MKIQVDTEKCIGAGMCEAVAPQLFELEDDGISVALKGPGSPQEEAELDEAISHCPVDAISRAADEGDETDREEH